jgi:GT2 family glycosyltransferase
MVLKNYGQDYSLTVSVIIVSFNTKILLRKCLSILFLQLKEIPSEVIVIDNNSQDGSPEMLKEEFPKINLIESKANLGFGRANNLGLVQSRGKYVVLLNSDAFVEKGSLSKAIAHMDKESSIALGGGQLIGSKGEWQPSGRQFPSLLNDFLHLSGLAAKYPRSKFFGRADHTWKPRNQKYEIDWPPGAFSIIRKSVLEKIGGFDPRFFFYYEEVDLCQRIKIAGYKVMYWPDVIITHLGGESIKNIKNNNGSKVIDLTLWRLRSLFLYYRKYKGFWGALNRKNLEIFWHQLRICKNKLFSQEDSLEKINESKKMIEILHQTWKETEGGKISPPQPWSF